VTPLTLRTKLTLWYTTLLAVLLSATGLIYYRALVAQVDTESTRELSELTSGLHGYLRIEQGQVSLDYDRNDPEQAAFVERAGRYFQAYDVASGELLHQSTALVPLGVQYTPQEVRAFAAEPRTIDVLTDRGRLRLSNSIFAPARGGRYLIQIGVRLNITDAALDWFLTLLLWSFVPCVIIAVIAGRWMAGRALAPLVRLAAETRAIDVGGLDRRLTVGGAGDELDAVAHAFNDTLDRLARAIGDMKQFSTALAHELRTPLAAMRGETELALMHARSPEDLRRGLASQLEELDRLAHLITELLTLARAEAGDIRLAADPVDVAALARSVCQSLAPVAESRSLALTCSATDAVTVSGDAGWLERLLLNLVDNAIAFTPAGGQVTIRVAAHDESALIEVTDTGIGISPADLPHLFERFYQAEPSRTARGGGIGLGLSLALWIAERHNGSIDVTSQTGRGSLFSVRLPLAPR
jgi:heavy metal sensor kinase